MSKKEIMLKLKQAQKNCYTNIERDGYGYLKRETCILHRYFQSIGKKIYDLNHLGCLGGEEPCSEMLRILGLDADQNHCPTIHKEIYEIVKNYKSLREIKI
jgi:hypothetical protein